MYRQTKNGMEKHWDFIIVDIFALELSLFLAYIIYYKGQLPIYSDLYRSIILLLPLAHIVAATGFNNYSGILRRGYLKELKSVLIQCLVIAASALIYFFVLQVTQHYSRWILALTAVFAVIFMYLGRIGLKAVLKKISAVPYMAVITPSAEAENLVDELVKNSGNNYCINAIIYSDRTPDEDEKVQEVPVVGSLGSFDEYMRQQVVDEVFVALPLRDERVAKIMKTVEEVGATVHVSVPSLFPDSFPQTISHIGACTTVTSTPKLVSLGEMFIKRAIDIAAALVGLLATGIAYLFVAPVVKKQAPGPIFFSQTRVGRNGRLFKIYKFRSMYMDAEERKKELMSQNQMQGLMFKLENDPRIFPFGHFLRKSSIDELPQFWNVLKGDMSLVGTRPPTLDEYKQYELHHKFRLAFKPGITGMWQVSGRSKITDFEEVVKLDGEYIKNWSVGLDIKIILKTVMVVLKSEGAE
ncbi:MAG: sugar transferase [Firmicutes bacterium]|nr:sugar transferase [Bacillota bacterium]